jgi:sulfoacetaldehyde dehydrogenase
MSDDIIDAIVARARAAQAAYEADGSQARYDRASQAVAWAIMEPARNKELAELAVQTTGLGNVADKITKNHRKTLGLMRDIKAAKTFGVIADDSATGITEIARAKGVVAAIVPSTNPAATPANNIINALKCGNAIVVAPSPKGIACAERLLEMIHAEFAKIGEDPDLTSCSSENSVVVVDAVYDAFVAAMAKAGGAIVDDEAGIVTKLWPDGHLNRSVIAQDADRMIAALDLDVPEGTDYIAVPTSGIGPDYPLSGEKLSRVLALYRAPDFNAAIDVTRTIQLHQGAGHSVGLHSSDAARPIALATAIPTSRVIVNQAHTFATGGSFTNGMPFSLSMGCGTWGGNSVNDNVNYRHFMQSTKIVREIPAREPSLEDIFERYWAEVGA